MVATAGQKQIAIRLDERTIQKIDDKRIKMSKGGGYSF
jgi:hypothetical protein